MDRLHTITLVYLGDRVGGRYVLCDRSAELGWKDYWFVRDAVSRRLGIGFLFSSEGEGFV